MPNPNLTFGIELEFVAVHSHRRPFEIGTHIHEALLAAGVPVTGFESLDLDIDSDAVVPEFSRWMIKDESLNLTSSERELLPRNGRSEDIEICSRKFHFRDPGWREEVATVLRVLDEVEARTGGRFVTNMTCGFHVHVGHDAARIPLRVAKNVFQIVTAFERHIDALHLPERFDEDFACDIQFHRPVSFFHRRRKQYANTSNPSQKLTSRLADVEAVDSYETLGAMFECRYADGRNDWTLGTSGHNSNVNFDNLFTSYMDSREKPTGTVEFREHAGTLDLLTIIAWIVVVVRIVEVAEEAVGRDADFLKFLLQGAKEGFESCDGEGNDATIGHLPMRFDGEQSSVSLQNADYTPLIEQNDDEFEERADPKPREELLEERAGDGEYGIHPRRDSTPRSEVICRLLDQILQMQDGPHDELTEELVSECRRKALTAIGQNWPAA